MSNRVTTLRRKISVIKSRYPKLRNTQVWERHDRMVAELKKLESDGGLKPKHRNTYIL